MPPRTDTGSRAGAVFLLVLSQSTQALGLGGIALFLPLIKEDLHLTFTQAGLLSSSAGIAYAAMQLPSGFLADRVGARRVFLVGLIGTNLLTISLAVLNNYGLILANQTVSGVFRALAFAPGLVLIATYFAPDRRATAIGLFVAGGFSSNILLNALGPLLVGRLGWRVLIGGFGAAGLAVVLLLLLVTATAPQRPGQGGVSMRDAWVLFKQPVMWTFAGIQYVRLAVAGGLAFWLPTLVVFDKHQSLVVAGLVVALGAALTAPSNFLGGYIADRSGRPLLVIGVSLGSLAVSTLVLPYVSDLRLLVPVIALNAFFVQLYFGPLFSLPIQMLGSRQAGLMTGFGNLFANLGGVTSVFVLGALKDRTGSFGVGLTLLGAACIVGLALTAGLARGSLRGRVAAQP